MTIPVLMYHAVAAVASPITIHPDTLSAQLSWLHQAGFHTITFGTLVEHIRNQRPFPPRTVCLTFDDGFAHLYDHLLPLLQTYGFVATVFLVSDYCGKSNAWPGQPPGIPIFPLLDWPHIREMARYGVEFGAHTVSHPRLDQLPPADARTEILQSRATIEEQIGQAVTTFAYPYGRFNPTTQHLVAESFAGACTTAPGRAGPHSIPSAIPRADVFYLQSPPLFRRLDGSLLFSYLKLRRFVSRTASTLLRRPW